MNDVDFQINRIKKGVSQIICEDELKERIEHSIKTSTPLRVKFGADPSAPDIHLGHTVALGKLKVFQELGHRVIFLIGDWTGMIGDPSGKSQTRKPPTKEQVLKNAKTYKEQVFKVLDREKTEVVFNSSWLEKISSSDIVHLCAKTTVARLLEREDFKNRYTSGSPISLHEFLYPLFQAYDSVVLNSDVEIGGTDQTFNLLLGRQLQVEYLQKPQVVITMPLLEGTDGVQKMSKSLGNHIGINDASDDMFGKIMSIPDTLMRKYYELLLEKDFDKNTHPMQIKISLAYSLTSMYKGKDEAEKAKERFQRVFSQRQPPEQINEYFIKNDRVWLVRLITGCGGAKSLSQARRIITGGGVRLNNNKISDPKIEVLLKDGDVLQVGKRFFVKMRLLKNPNNL
ncbi:tyrosine--tRNA ligase [bacterium Unc6]|nr:tyrosine--tRNA ligase [bacterium Unc6]